MLIAMCMCIYIYIYMYMNVYVYIYIYIHREMDRERGREREYYKYIYINIYTNAQIYIQIQIYIYVHIYIQVNPLTGVEIKLQRVGRVGWFSDGNKFIRDPYEEILSIVPHGSRTILLSMPSSVVDGRKSSSVVEQSVVDVYIYIYTYIYLPSHTGLWKTKHI